VVQHGAMLPHWERGVVARFEWVYRNDSELGVTFRWHGSDTLVIQYARASRQYLKRPSVDGPHGPVIIVLARGVVDSTAPAGSMVRVRYK
jgi:hypothetical protein